MKRVMRVLSTLAAFCFMASATHAQDFSAMARLDPAQSQVRDTEAGLHVTLYLSQPVPYRVFTLDEPRRLVMDFREIDWRGASREALLNADNATDLRFGPLRPGWSRMVVDLAAPLAVELAGMEVDKIDGTARLDVLLDPVTPEVFAARTGAPPDPDWDSLVSEATTLPAPAPVDDGIRVVVIDPGHGGIDPGAERDGAVEADLMLRLSLELAEALARAGDYKPVLTREADVFVPLTQRITIARAAGADLFISLHADALDDEVTRGASVYTLTDEASDTASQRMAERHERGDLLAGLDLSGQDDTVATVLMDLARLETSPASERLAAEIVQGLNDAEARLNSRPMREAQLAVLGAADFPSVLVEVGFLSNARDRELIASVEGRARIVAGLVRAIQRWDAEDRARAPLVRQ